MSIHERNTLIRQMLENIPNYMWYGSCPDHLTLNWVVNVLHIVWEELGFPYSIHPRGCIIFNKTNRIIETKGVTTLEAIHECLYQFSLWYINNNCTDHKLPKSKIK